METMLRIKSLPSSISPQNFNCFGSKEGDEVLHTMSVFSIPLNRVGAAIMRKQKRNIVTTIALTLFIASFIGLHLLDKLSALSSYSKNAISTNRSVSEPDSEVFGYVYKKGHWGPGSGYGSDNIKTKKYKQFLQTFFDSEEFQSFVDLGCGDFQIMRHMKVPLNKTYTGIDVVPEVLNRVEKMYGGSKNPNYKFVLIDDLTSLKLGSEVLQADLVIIKHVLQVWSNKHIQYFIDNILPNFKYALITNRYEGADDLNEDISQDDAKAGLYRPVDLTYTPFNLRNTKLVLRYFEDGIQEQRTYMWYNPKLTGGT